MSGWVKPRLGIFSFLEILCFLCVLWVFFWCTCFQKKKMDKGVCGWCLANPSFSRIFLFFLTWQDPLMLLHRMRRLPIMKTPLIHNLLSACPGGIYPCKERIRYVEGRYVFFQKNIILGIHNKKVGCWYMLTSNQSLICYTFIIFE